MTQPLDLDAIEARHEYYLARRSSRSCPAHPSADDVLALAAEIRRLRAQLAGRRDQVLTEAAVHLERIADETEAQVAAHYGRASGIGPGSADMVREAARSVRSLAALATSPSV
ncbi:hypothetical protein GCM10010193_70120 [Kitasatospora atroaurantiaca]|uniref:Uncharacterized protein n=1 Tax=Kitasatospora atroaurantiaca TaxID=285545 RepID=A0A561ENA0_9ACTN|nr:hypothetical protein [Kitasatospora atroaurantiaca]TWE17098.1 hypothetical protein FB465_2103 [Kitasatospora atroaurantiaca]